MNRRHFIAAATAGLLAMTAMAAEKKPYNVLMISVDDLNDWTGFMKQYPSARTPNIDQLAKEGIYFSNAQAAAPLCNPCRTAVLTGLRPDQTGIYGNTYNYTLVLKDRLTLPRYFRNNGFYVCGAGKLFHGDYCDNQDWDEYLLRDRDEIPSGGKNKKQKIGKAAWAKLDVDDAAMDDTKMVNYAIDKLNEKHDRPFFIHCGTYKPHLPWDVPKKYFDLHPLSSVVLPDVPEDDLDDIPPAGLAMIEHSGSTVADLKAAGKWKEAVQAYLAAHSFADAQVGRLLDALKASPSADNTIVVLWGDHGWHLGEKEHWTKNTLWERATHAPLIFKVPGFTQPGQRIITPVDFMNIYPTLADLCGLEIPAHCEGVSMKPLLADPDLTWKRPAVTTCGEGNHAMRDSRWRYICYKDGSEELYDHENDPNEWKNLADVPELGEVKARLAQWIPTGVPQLNIKNYKKMAHANPRRRGVIVTPDDAVGKPATKYYPNKTK